MCGEKLSAVFTSCINLGSPPRVRGKGVPCSARRLGRGITPARAGKSKWHYSKSSCAGDHPRVCGEKCTNVCRRTHHKGSPPRVRGKANVANPAFNVARITPACAGKSQNGLKKTADDRGSPPRVRGKGWTCRGHRNRHRITPACAGKRPRMAATFSLAWDHPRVCGEK